MEGVFQLLEVISELNQRVNKLGLGGTGREKASHINHITL